MRHVFLATVFSAFVIAASPAWADHDHGGHDGGHGGGWGGGHGSWSGGHSGWSGGHGGWDGGHSHVSFGHSGWGGGWGGNSINFYSGHGSYGWPYRSYYSSYYRPYSYFYRPYSYATFGYPYLYNYSYPSSYYFGYGYPTYYSSYPSDYFASGNSYYGTDVDVEALPPREYVVSRPVGDVARLEIRLPDPQATIWVQGKEIPSSGAVRQFKSPPLDPSHQYSYSVRCEWNDNGKVVSEERQVNVEPNGQSVVDFTRRDPAARDSAPALPSLPPPNPRP